MVAADSSGAMRFGCTGWAISETAYDTAARNGCQTPPRPVSSDMTNQLHQHPEEPVKLLGKLPQGQANGLTVIGQQLVDEPLKIHTIIALIDSPTAAIDNDSGDVTPNVRIRAIEVIEEDKPTLARLLRRAKDSRLGINLLPFDTEESLDRIFEGI